MALPSGLGLASERHYSISAGGLFELRKIDCTVHFEFICGACSIMLYLHGISISRLIVLAPTVLPPVHQCSPPYVSFGLSLSTRESLRIVDSLLGARTECKDDTVLILDC